MSAPRKHEDEKVPHDEEKSEESGMNFSDDGDSEFKDADDDQFDEEEDGRAGQVGAPAAGLGQGGRFAKAHEEEEKELGTGREEEEEKK